MRALFILLSLFITIFFTSVTAQQNPVGGYWMFVGVKLFEKVPNCNNRCSSVQKHWVYYENPQSADHLRKQVNQQIRPELVFINPKNYKVIAVVIKQVDCKGQIPSYGFKAGKSREEIIKGLEWDKQHKFFGLVDYEIEEWIDVKQELAKLNPPSGASVETVRKDPAMNEKIIRTIRYNKDIEIKYTIGKMASGRIVTHARITNNSNKPVAINFYKDGMPTQLEKANRTYLGQLGISPNESVSHLIYTDNFSVVIGEPKEGTILKNELGITDRLINEIKKGIRDHIEVKDGKIQSTGGTGVRG